MTGRRWCRTLARVELDVPCGDEVHRVVLHRGKLVLDAHVIAAEAAVFALGGASPPCFEVYRSWRARALWETALEPRGPGFHQLYRRPPLPRELVAPLELGVARAWERRAARGAPDATRALDAATRSRAEPALRAALDADRKAHGGGPVASVELRVGATPRVSGRLTEKETRVSVRLAADWYRTVGRPGPALDAGRFVVAHHPRLVLAWRQTAEGEWSAHTGAVDP